MVDCFLVIPCFHESRRVPVFLDTLCREIAASGLSVKVLLVDDGSGVQEVEQLRKVVARCRNSYPFLTEVFALGKNRGKGAAIRAGWAIADEDTKLLGFVDADGSVSAEETVRVLREALAGSRPGLVMASRRAAGAIVNRSLLRKTVAAGFAGLVRFSYGVQVLDTQCGCKFVDAAWYRQYERGFREEGFGLDLELILKAKETGLMMHEIGIAWHEEAGSKVGFSAVWSLGKAVVLRKIGRSS